MSVLDKLRLDGKVALMTGAGRGLGCVMAVALAEAGADSEKKWFLTPFIPRLRRSGGRSTGPLNSAQRLCHGHKAGSGSSSAKKMSGHPGGRWSGSFISGMKTAARG